MISTNNMDLWNVKNLQPPPILTAIADVKEIDLKFLRNTLKDAVDFFENQPHLFTEAALLSRMIYRMKMKFRSSKDLKALEMLNRALRKYLYLQIPKVLKSFLDSIPQTYKAKKTYLPSKHMIDFVLVRLQSLGKTLMKIYEFCKKAAILAQQRVRLGHFWKIAIMFYAMSARIFVITKSLIKYTCELYTNMLPFATKLNNSGKDWLPAGYEFPESLNEWLEIDWVDLETTVIEIPDDEPHALSYFDLIDDSDDDDIEFCDEYILVKDDLSAIFDMSDDKKETGDESVIEIIEQTPSGRSNVERDVEIISLCDTQSLPPKANSITDGFNGFCEDVDVGEIVQVDDEQALQPKEKTLKKKADNQKATDAIDVTNLSEAESITDGFKGFCEVVDVGEVMDGDQTPIPKKKAHNQKADAVEVINLSTVVTPPNIKQKRKKKKKNNKNLQLTPKDDMQIMNQKTNSNSDMLNDDCSVISLTDSEGPKGKKRKRDIDCSVISLTDSENLIKRKKRKGVRPKNKINVQGNIYNSDTSIADCSVISLTDPESPIQKKRKCISKINNEHPNTSGYNPNMASASTEGAKKVEVSVPTLTDSESPIKRKKRKGVRPKNKTNVQGNIYNSDTSIADCSVISLTDPESTIWKKRKSVSKNNNNQENNEHPNTSGYNPKIASASTEEAKKVEVSVPTLTNSNKKQKRRRSKRKIGSAQKNDASVTCSQRPGAVTNNESNSKNTKLHDRLRESIRIKQVTYKGRNYKSFNKFGNSNDTYKGVEEDIQSEKKKKKKKRKKSGYF